VTIEAIKKPLRKIKPLREAYRKTRRAIEGPPPKPRPKMLSVEPTNRCNLNCPFCLVGLQNTYPSTEHDFLKRGFGFMDMDLFAKICRDAQDFCITRMQLHFQGEPLLHKQFPEMVRMAKAHGMKTQVFTNGLVMNEKIARAVIESGLDYMRFSVDGASQETYGQNRVGGDFEKVYANMALMVRTAEEYGSPIDLQWQYIALRNNEHEIQKAKEMADATGIPFMVKTFAQTDPNLVPRDPRLRRNLQPKPCTDIYRAIFVFWNGEVVPCCYDMEGKEIVGDLNTQTLEEIWDSERYVELRRRIDSAARNPSSEPEICKSCLKWGHSWQIETTEESPTTTIVHDLV
jgi:radical SAM protein with 4Fe4S-binding SPASM domain